ncbi:antibiotic biosynthesis monooxygenase family protein [Spirillospora sp. NPDC127200]
MVTFVNRFSLTAPPAEFERGFAGTSGFMAEQPGFVGYTLLRHTERPDSYVNIAVWRDAQSFRDAVTRPEFAPHAAALRSLSTSEPNLYVIARQGAPVRPGRGPRA